MRPSRHIHRTVAAFALLVAASASVTAQLEIVRSTVDGGGVINSIGGTFELSGTIGQPDAGLMTGGPFEVTGGFWFAIPPADCNEDGLVNLLDHKALVQCLSGPGGPAAAGSCRCLDVDQNGTVDLGDFAEAQLATSGP